MFASIYLQRRRIAFGMFFCFLSGLLDFGRFGGSEVPFYIITLSLVFAVICGAILGVLLHLFPGFRQVVEIGAVTSFLLRLGEVAPALSNSGSGWFAISPIGKSPTTSTPMSRSGTGRFFRGNGGSCWNRLARKEPVSR